MKNTLITLLLMLSLNTQALTVEQVWQEINCNELYSPHIVLAQTINEAGWNYDSHNATRRNNLLGIKGGSKCESNKYGYRIFNHWTECIEIYKEKIQNRYIQGEDYYSFLLRIKYAESEDYINDLKWIVNKLKDKYEF